MKRAVNELIEEQGKERETMVSVDGRCSRWKEDQNKSVEYQEWLKCHNCHLNHEGSAGATEP